MRLYLVGPSYLRRDPEFSTDLFVWADSPDQAVEHWDHHWYKMDVVVLPDTAVVFEVPTEPVDGAVDWQYVVRHEIKA